MAVRFDASVNWNVIVTATMILLAGAGLYFGLDKTVAVLTTAIEGKLNVAEQRANGLAAEVKAEINAATMRVDGQIGTINSQLGALQQDRGRLEASVTTLSDQRYTKLDAIRDADAQGKRFDELGRRMDMFEQINRAQDQKLEELQRVVNRIADSINAVHLPPRGPMRGGATQE